MKLIPVFLLILFSRSVCHSEILIEPDTYLTEQKKEIFLTVEDWLFNDRFESADSLINKFISENSSDPGGYLLKASMMLSNMIDKETNLYSDYFLEILDSIYVLTDNSIDTCNRLTKAWMYLFQGHARIYHSLWAEKFSSGFSALKLAYKAKGNYEKGLKCDSTLYDLYMGLGAFHYWKSIKAGFLRTIGIFRNDKDKGLKELTLAKDSSLISKESTMNVLTWILINEKKYDSAIVICQELLKKYPEGKLFLWPLAFAYFANAQYDEAIDVYNQLRGKISSNPGNYYNLIECDYYLFLCYLIKGSDTQAVESAQKIYEYADKIPPGIKKRQKPQIELLEKQANGL